MRAYLRPLPVRIPLMLTSSARPKRTPVILQPMARGEQRYKPYDVPSYATRAEVPARGEVGGSRAKGANLEELSEKHWRESWEESARTAVGGARMQGSSKGVEEGKGKKVEVIELLDTDEEEEMEMERSRGKKERKRERRALRRAAEEVAVEGREVGVEEGDAEGKGKGKARRVQDAMIILGTSSPSPPPENFSATTVSILSSRWSKRCRADCVHSTRTTSLRPSHDDRPLSLSSIIDLLPPPGHPFSTTGDTARRWIRASRWIRPNRRRSRRGEEQQIRTTRMTTTTT